MLSGYIDAPTFYDGVELAATDINVLTANARLLDQASQRAASTFNVHRKLVNWEAKAVTGAWLWRGGFMYRNGATTARFSFAVAEVGTNKLKITFDGTVVYDADITNGVYNIDIAINARGYTDRQIITVVCTLYANTGEIHDTTAYFYDAYVFPISGANPLSWPGIPTFGTIDQTRLNQLSNAEDWLAERLGMVPYNADMSLLYFQSPRNIPGVWPVYYATVTPTNGNTRLKGALFINSRNVSTHVRIAVNGTNFDYGPYSYGQNSGFFYDIDLISQAGCSLDTDYQVVVSEYIVTGNPVGLPKEQNSRISLGDMRVDKNTYSPLALPSDLVMADSYAYSTVKSTLTTIGTALTTIKSKIDANAIVFDRARMFRGRYGVKEDQDEYWRTNFVARNIRRGDVLYVKGKGLSIEYGSVTTKIEEKDEKWSYDFQYSQSLTSGDAIETKVVFLDQFEGLFPGNVYFITGTDIHYAAEFLR